MKKAYWVIGIIVIICLIAIVIIIPERSCSKYPYSIQSEWKNCNEDKDCYLVDTKCCAPCSFSNLSLNKYGKEAIENWMTWNCKVLDVVVSCYIPAEIPKSICSNNVCSAEYVTSVWVTELCKYNEEFSKNVSSSPECEGKDWKCVDGWSMTVYYDRRLTNTTIFETNLPEKPKELINATIAEYGSSVCDCKNPISYRILIGDKLEETDCETFYKFIDDYKSSCSGCVRKWETECC